LTEQTFFLPVIPTTSLFLTEELIGDKLDGFIWRIEGKSATFSKLLKSNMPYKWLKYNERKAPFLRLFYDHERNSEEPFGLSLTAGLALKLDIPEIWIHKLILHIIDEKWRDRLYTFVNKPITIGSQAEARVFNFYKKRKNWNWIKKVPRRHLELVDVTGLENYYWRDPALINFLSNTTHGLIFKKTVRQLSTTRFVDEDIVEA